MKNLKFWNGACWYQPHIWLKLFTFIQSRNFIDFNRKPFKTLNFCALTLWNFSGFFSKTDMLKMYFLLILWWRLHNLYITWSFLYIPVKISMVYVFCVTILHRKAEIWNQFCFFSKIWKDFFFISFFNIIHSGLKKWKNSAKTSKSNKKIYLVKKNCSIIVSKA